MIRPVPNVSLSFFLSLGFLCFFWLLSAVHIPVSAMEAHHISRKRSLADSEAANQTQMSGVEAIKKLRRLPHVFSRVLELPLKSDADVSVEVSQSCFRFIVDAGDGLCEGGRGVGVRVLQLYPGVVKVAVIGYGDEEEEEQMDGLELDKWRLRLPVTTRPENATAVCVDGELVVTVPTDSSIEEEVH